MVSQMHSPHLLSQECFVLNRLLLGWRIRGHRGGNLFLENQPDVRNCFVSLFDACFISYKRGCVPRDTLVYIQRQQIGHWCELQTFISSRQRHQILHIFNPMTDILNSDKWHEFWLPPLWFHGCSVMDIFECQGMFLHHVLSDVWLKQISNYVAVCFEDAVEKNVISLWGVRWEEIEQGIVRSWNTQKGVVAPWKG